MIKVMIYGANGKMAQVLSRQIELEKDMEIAVGIDRYNSDGKNKYPIYSDPYEYNGEVDVIIDFSHPSNLDQMLDFSIKRKIPLVIATTGLSEEQLKEIEDASKKTAILHSSNMSLGINILSRVLRNISKLLSEDFDIEIIEKHHNKKVDAPSGTAYLLANVINEVLDNSKEYTYGREGKNVKREKNEIGIHAIRGGTIAGEHTIIFAGDDEIIELKHTALSKSIFALGAIKAARFIVKSEEGLYTMDDIFCK
ncbi:4-hydroxy-tetrahydrodipicolinate reductase [Caproiciproducens sp. MSJ-32]|uniref:4-hydroxy-tetrahydrodipicolinate reductase n=1 Tax=Caproiciproducens sp. MSJ-32 TaxID=2841527 RepID=UPI001C11B834|nr:4-hydroxy-tetrahydrodipicolinate reductase [Caproiciproducens sp. MSJ-32]MBU5456112.1 4-hydroxy-tetrahydrodipicolinate reductase [Caproiciproducens sp. MSJ-32]